VLFNSLEFLIFFPLVTVVYFALPRVRSRQWLLLVASTIFYMAFIPAYAIVLYGTIVVDYFAAFMIEKSAGRKRRLWLAASIVANVGCLAVFKYCNFAIDNLNTLLSVVHSSSRLSLVELTLPVGLSFHTFQAMSYTIEVYRGNQKTERSFVVYALYVMFYPQLVAGPIERPQNVIHQLKELQQFDAERVTCGLRLMLWGFFKKVVVADRLSVIVSAVYATPGRFPGPILAVATLAFAIQIYADFSGYSDIALGSAEVMGIKLMTNFRQPYLSQSVSEFWSRWHISLSTWFRDYLYIPLGGNRVSPVRRRINLLITFVVSGLWHGANWTYVIWGGLNGLFLVAETLLVSRGRERSRGPLGVLKVALTVTLISFTWIFFRAASIGDAFTILSRLPTGLGLLAHPAALVAELIHLAVDAKRLALTVLGVVVLLVVDAMAVRRGAHATELLGRLEWRGRWLAYFALGVVMVLGGVFGRQQFIYFQF
jgi:alginate O-acetyltransferase complex protein AlgI